MYQKTRVMVNEQIIFPQVDLSGVKGVLLDIDNTLYTYQPCHTYALAVCEEKFRTKEPGITQGEFQALYQKARKRVNTDLISQGASHSRLLYFQKLFENYYHKTCFELTVAYDALYWDSFFEKMQLVPEAKAFFEDCKNKNVSICLITDLTAQIQYKKVLHLGIQDYIAYMVSSEEAGIEKPHPYMFKLALEKLNLSPNEVIMIGDNQKKDIAGAQQLDIKAYLVECQK